MRKVDTKPRQRKGAHIGAHMEPRAIQPEQTSSNARPSASGELRYKHKAWVGGWKGDRHGQNGRDGKIGRDGKNGRDGGGNDYWRGGSDGRAAERRTSPRGGGGDT
ncbi:unnamed protein product [Calypogeia fissa]